MAEARWLLPLCKAFHKGKTHLALCLGIRAVELGYQASFVTPDQLIDILKNEPALSRRKRLQKKL